MGLVKLHDEKLLLTELKTETVRLIHVCQHVDPIKKLIECHDILKLTFEINEKFPVLPPAPPQCDEPALLHLKMLTRELFVYHRLDFRPPSVFLNYTDKILRLLMVYQIPRKG